MLHRKIYTFDVSYNSEEVGETIQLQADGIKMLLLEDEINLLAITGKEDIVVILYPTYEHNLANSKNLFFWLEIKDSNEQLDFFKYFTGLRNTEFKSCNKSEINKLMTYYCFRFEMDLPDEELYDLEFNFQIKKKEKTDNKQKK